MVGNSGSISLSDGDGSSSTLIPEGGEDSLASRLKEVIGAETLVSFSGRSGVGESLLRKYLSGTQPTMLNLTRLAKTAGVTMDWLATGQHPRSRGAVMSVSNLPTVASDEEAQLLAWYRECENDQKEAVFTILEAIVKPGAMAWLRAGEALSRVANIFPRRRKGAGGNTSSTE